MSQFAVHTPQTAPDASRPMLEQARASFGFVPNLLGVLAESPAALEAYLASNRALEKAALTPAERQVAILTVSVENGCRYCVAAHSAIALGAGVPPDAVSAIRATARVGDPRLAALSAFTRAVVRNRAHGIDAELGRFLDAGFERVHVLDVLAIVALKTLSNYTNHLAETPLDGGFRQHAWEPAPLMSHAAAD